MVNMRVNLFELLRPFLLVECTTSAAPAQALKIWLQEKLHAQVKPDLRATIFIATDFCTLVAHSTKATARHTHNSVRSEMLIESEALACPRTPEEWHVDFVELPWAS